MVDKEVVFIVGGEQRGGSPSWHRSGFEIMKYTQKLSNNSSQEALTARVFWHHSRHTRTGRAIIKRCSLFWLWAEQRLRPLPESGIVILSSAFANRSSVLRALRTDYLEVDLPERL